MLSNRYTGQTLRSGLRTLFGTHTALRVCMLATSVAAISGCAADRDVWSKTVGNNTCEVDPISDRVDKPSPEIYQSSYSAPPITADMLQNGEFNSYTDLNLDDVVRMALQHSTVMRDLGGVVLRSPDTVKTKFNPGLTQTDPRFSMEAALSAFDAQLSASAMYSNNDRLYNNAFFAGGTSGFVQDLHEYSVSLDKRTATGALLSLRSRTLYDNNNAPANNFTNYYESLIEAEIRQPLLQGAGLEFNRIAGPGAQPGLYNGILIAKTNSDISQHEFQIAIRDYLSNVENAYWDLYLAYRELDARKKAMEEALDVWRAEDAKAKAEGIGNVQGGEESYLRGKNEFLARQQYYKFKADVDDSISGRLLQGTQTRNGSNGGTLQGSGGVLAAERRLRLLIGLPASDGSLLRPAEDPTMAKVLYDWSTVQQEALTQRAELRRQQLVVKKREMELLAAENFLNPRLDAIARYRVRGLGDDLIANGPNSGNLPNSSVGNLFSGEHQEYMIGVELQMPVGFRQAHAAVSNAEFAVAHAQAIYKEQQREVVNDLSAAIADAARAHLAIENNLNQYLAARSYLDALNARRVNNLNDPPDLILDAQTRLVEAEVRLFRSRAEYAVALKNIQYEKGTLLNYANLHMVNYDTPAEPNPMQEPTPIQPAPEMEPIPGPETIEAATAERPAAPKTEQASLENDWFADFQDRDFESTAEAETSGKAALPETVARIELPSNAEQATDSSSVSTGDVSSADDLSWAEDPEVEPTVDEFLPPIERVELPATEDAQPAYLNELQELEGLSVGTSNDTARQLAELDAARREQTQSDVTLTSVETESNAKEAATVESSAAHSAPASADLERRVEQDITSVSKEIQDAIVDPQTSATANQRGGLSKLQFWKK